MARHFPASIIILGALLAACAAEVSSLPEDSGQVSSPDGGVPPDAGVAADGGIMPDGGSHPPDGGEAPGDDAGTPPAKPYPNQPQGQGWAASRDYLVRDEAGWQDTSVMSIVPDSSSNHGGSIGRRLYPQGATGGAGVAGRLSIPGAHGRIYIHFRVRLSEDWRNHSSGINKFVYLWSASAPKMILTAYGTSPVPAFLLRHAPGNTSYVGPDPANTHPERGVMTRGRWYEIELLVQSSSAPGIADGTAAWWMDGHLLRRLDGLDTHFAGESLHWHNLEWNSIWGGVGDEHEVDMWMDMDHFHVSAGPRE
jgi:hypothetical protein